MKENIREIKSSQNQRFKKTRSLLSKKGRDRENLFIVEGQKLWHEANIYCKNRIKYIFILERYDGPIPEGDVFIIDEKLFSQLSELKNPEGIITVLKKQKKDDNFSEKTLLLDGISDPGNLGTLMRTAEAFDHQVILGPNCADPYHPRAVRASMGALIRRTPKTIDLEDIKNLHCEYNFYGTILENGKPLPKKYEKPYTIVLGSESHGISDEIINLLDKRIKIPMEKESESLNVAAAGAIILYSAYEK